MMKTYNMSMREVLYGISYTNIIMLCSTTPDYSLGKDKENKQNTIDASNPANNAMVLRALGM